MYCVVYESGCVLCARAFMLCERALVCCVVLRCVSEHLFVVLCGSVW